MCSICGREPERDQDHIQTSPDEEVYIHCIMYTSVCVPQSVNIEYIHMFQPYRELGGVSKVNTKRIMFYLTNSAPELTSESGITHACTCVCVYVWSRRMFFSRVTQKQP